MKKFTFTVVSLSFVVLAFVFMIDIAVTKGLQKSKDYRFEIWTDIMHDNVNADVIFLGNSRAAMHFDVSVFDSILECSSYNFGRQGLPGNLTMYPFLIYREKTDQLPKYVIYNIDFMSFSESNMPWMKNLPQVAPYVADSLLQKMITLIPQHFDLTLFISS